MLSSFPKAKWWYVTYYLDTYTGIISSDTKLFQQFGQNTVFVWMTALYTTRNEETNFVLKIVLTVISLTLITHVLGAHEQMSGSSI